MNEELLNSEFNRLVQNIQTDIIKVHVVPDAVLKGKNPNTSLGFNEVRFDQNHKFVYAYILIDEQLDAEMKLNTLYHEYGHVNHYLSLGDIEIQRLRSINDFDWVVKDEYEAFKYQLSSIKQHGNPLLKNLMVRLEQRALSDNQAYKEAIQSLIMDDLWKTCLACIK